MYLLGEQGYLKGDIVIKKSFESYEFEDLDLIKRRKEELERREEEVSKMIFRICSRCGERKILFKFSVDKRNKKTGKTRICKTCRSRESLRRYYEDPLRVQVGSQIYRDCHKEERKIYNEKYWDNHKEELKKKAKKWYIKNKKAIKKRSLLYYNEHKEEVKVTKEIWRLVNRERIKKYNREYKKKLKRKGEEKNALLSM